MTRCATAFASPTIGRRRAGPVSSSRRGRACRSRRPPRRCRCSASDRARGPCASRSRQSGTRLPPIGARPSGCAPRPKAWSAPAARGIAYRTRELDEREASARSVGDQLRLLARNLAQDPRAASSPDRRVRPRRSRPRPSARCSTRPAAPGPPASVRPICARPKIGRVASASESPTCTVDSTSSAAGAADLAQLEALAERADQRCRGGRFRRRTRHPRLRSQAREHKVERDLDALLAKSPDLRGPVLAAAARQADRLAKEARSLAGRQRDESRGADDASAHQARAQGPGRRPACLGRRRPPSGR